MFFLFCLLILLFRKQWRRLLLKLKVYFFTIIDDNFTVEFPPPPPPLLKPKLAQPFPIQGNFWTHTDTHTHTDNLGNELVPYCKLSKQDPFEMSPLLKVSLLLFCCL